MFISYKMEIKFHYLLSMANYSEAIKKSNHCTYVLFFSFYLQHLIVSESQLEDYRSQGERKCWEGSDMGTMPAFF